ncbi:MAG TPA: 23S rRNA (pseudouridine(1915)-N(3))-methyltransferase RlmH [Saprospiraceae bacterium]|nr:23S rRNA (pseudouridine(1915)-N(3))-methyltransferase RlmH [Saprospiraceae bacterium]
MKVHLWAFGSPSDSWLAEGEKIYTGRIEHYLPFEYKTIHASKSNKKEIVLTAEIKWLKLQLQNTPSRLILLDEKGTQFTSPQFSTKLEQWRQGSHRRLIFLIGSAYGFDDSIYTLADDKLSISKFTLPHQLCRLIFLEQMYRACTILRGQSYHHE